MSQQIQDRRTPAATDDPPITAFTGAYSSTAQSPSGDVLSPLIVDDSGHFTLLGTAFGDTHYDSTQQAWVFGPQPVNGKDSTFTLSGAINFTAGTPPTFNGNLTIAGVSDPIPFPGTQIVDLPAPTLGSASDAAGVLQTGDVIKIGTPDGKWLYTTKKQGLVTVFWGQIPAANAASFTVTEAQDGQGITLATADGVVTISDVGTSLIVVSGATPAVFTPNASCAGGAMFLTTDGRYWMWGTDVDGGNVMIASQTTLSETVQFVVSVTPVSYEELCRRYNITLPENLSDCDLALASFSFQLFGGFFLAIGLGPYLFNDKAAPGVMAILKTNPQVWKIIEDGATSIQNNPGTAAAVAASVGASALFAAYEVGLLWTVIKFLLAQAGWWALFYVIAKIIEWCLVPEAETVEMMAYLIVWCAATVACAATVYNKCGKTQPLAANPA